MQFRIVTTVAFLFQVVLGQICMMQMDSAEAMDMDSMHAMHCENCSPEDNTQKEEPMDCTSGHCLMHTKPLESASFNATSDQEAMSMPPSPEIAATNIVKAGQRPISTAPPDTPSNERNGILLC